jgi:hypothetical protein
LNSSASRSWWIGSRQLPPLIRPILYRCILCLGSLPFHNQLASILTVDVLRIAVIILLPRSESNKDLGADDNDAQPEEWLRELLFQYMRAIQDSGAPTVEGGNVSIC